MVINKYASAPIQLEEMNHLKKDTDFTDLLLTSKAAEDDEVNKRFTKFAKNLKRVAPKANDFTYFSAVMLHSAESSIIDYKTGEPLKDRYGNEVTAEWEINEKTGSWKWKCSDSSIKPYRNNNKDIFPEPELKKAYRKWIGRPLCKDHQSSSVDGIRGIIVDAYYDDKRKRVIGLCALDKVNYPDLARKVESGYATDVSMGTAVGVSCCNDCGNLARTENEYCSCVRNRTTYGEINLELSPIELSLVVTGADPNAKLKRVFAALNKYSEEKNERIQELRAAGCVTPGELKRLEDELEDLKKTLKFAMNKVANVIPNLDEATRINTLLQNPELSDKARKNLNDALEELLGGNDEVEVEPLSATQSKEEMGDTGYSGQSKDAVPPEWSMEGSKLASVEFEDMIVNINKKLGAMELALRDMAAGAQEAKNKEESMSEKELQERAAARRAMFKNAYHLGGGGVNDPQTYPVDPLNDQLKTKGDKQMEGQGMEPGKDGLHPGYDSFGQSEESLKKMLSRAELDERKAIRKALLKNAEEDVEQNVDELKGKESGGVTFVKHPTKPDTVVALNDDGSYNEVDDAQIQAARDLVKMIGRGSNKKEAYWLGGGGVNEPQTYPVDPLNDQLKTKGDKQMEGQGMESGKDGLHPGYQSYGNEKALKEKLLRAELRAKFVLAFENEDKTVIDKKNSRWEIYAGPEKILEATGSEIYEDELEENWEVLASKKWGREVLRAIREDGIDKVAYYLKGIVKEAQPPLPGGPAEIPGLPGGAPELPAPEPTPEAAEEPVVEEEDPVKAALTSASEHLEEVEKALGDLEKACEEMSGEKSDNAELDTSGIAEANDSYMELHASLDESADELAMLAESLDSRVKNGQSVKDPITAELVRLTTEAVETSKELIVEAKKKKEEKEEMKEEKEDKKSKKEEKKSEKEDKKSKKEEVKEEKEDKKGKKEEKKEEKEEKKSDKEEKKSEKEDKKKSKAELMVEELLKVRADNRRKLAKKAAEEDLDEERIKRLIQEQLDEYLGSAGLEELGEEEVDEEENMEELEPALEVGEEDIEFDALDAELAQMLNDYEAEDAGLEAQASARKEWRNKVAAELGAKYQLTLDSQTTVDTDMPLGKNTPLTGLDTKTDEAVIEGIVEQHNEILKKLQSFPKVREAMEHLGNMLKSGKLKVDELDNSEKLQALAVDPDAAKYWKEYFGEIGNEGKEFANELTKEYTQKKVKASIDNEKIKMRRAYDVALSMQDKGLIGSSVSDLHAQVDEIMKFDDKSFESYKRALDRVNKVSKIKTAAPALNVGMNDESVVEETPVNLASQLSKLFD